MHRPGNELATSRSRVRRSTNTLTEQPVMTDTGMCVVDGRLDVNVALNRPSYQVSTYANAYFSHYGNDGDKTLCDASTPPFSVIVTTNALNPWYVIDLSVPLHVAGVRLTNRADGWSKCKSRCYLTHNTLCSTRPAYLHFLLNYHIPTRSLRSANRDFPFCRFLFRCFPLPRGRVRG